MSNKNIRICVHCEEEYNVKFKRVGLITSCNRCGEAEDKDTPRFGGVLEFAHKTAPVLKIMTLADAKEIKRRTDRKGGSGIIVGMAETR
jgi:anaerobic ribonucleoside-triphosphate reductase